MAVVLGVAPTVARMKSVPDKVQQAFEAAGPDIARYGEGQVKSFASRGRPGPEVDTGAFLGSIRGQFEGTRVVIGSSSAYAARLEFGFYGYDSLGRFYQQPPYPSFQPATPAIRDYAVRTVATSIQRKI